jgi:transcriptional antiterminator RfaH
MTKAWYALRTKPHKEESVRSQIDGREIESFYPRLRVNPVNPRARRVRPYFPGYIFVNADLKTTSIATFQFMPHAIGLVCFGGEPGTLPDPVIERLRQHLDRLNRSNHKETFLIQPGERVKIRKGPLEGYQAILDHHLPGRDRVRVLLELIGSRNVPVELSYSSIGQI